MRQLACATALFLTTVVPGAMQDAERTQQRSSEPRATPVDPVGAIVEAFQSHSIVTLSDPHGNQRVLAFLLTVLRDPRIHQIVNDVVVENGNARYQGSMDRYARGEDVPHAELRQVWENTTQPQVVTPRGRFVPEPIHMGRGEDAG